MTQGEKKATTPKSKKRHREKFEGTRAARHTTDERKAREADEGVEDVLWSAIRAVKIGSARDR